MRVGVVVEVSVMKEDDGEELKKTLGKGKRKDVTVIERKILTMIVMGMMKKEKKYMKGILKRGK